MQVPVRIADEMVTIDVYQAAKTVWEASGTFEGRAVTVRKGSRAAVLLIGGMWPCDMVIEAMRVERNAGDRAF